MAIVQVRWQLSSLGLSGNARRKASVPSYSCRCSNNNASVGNMQQDSGQSFCSFPRRFLLGFSLSTILTFPPVMDNSVSAKTYYKEYTDLFDGYTFQYPENWMQVRGANADIFFRDPINIDENVSVEFSSPSSSRFKSVEDLGPPEAAAKRILQQYLTEFMSTRLGVQRESSILSTASRVADDGKLYYDIEVNVKSFANNNQLAIMPQDRVQLLEWNRRYLTVLGVENNCLYQMRLQIPERVFAQEENDLRKVMNSFRVMSNST